MATNHGSQRRGGGGGIPHHTADEKIGCGLILAAIISCCALLYFAGTAVLWEPKLPEILITGASITSPSANFTLQLSFANPNTKGGEILYDSIRIDLVSGLATLATTTIPPFYQDDEVTSLLNAESTTVEVVVSTTAAPRLLEAIQRAGNMSMTFDVKVAVLFTFMPRVWAAESYHLNLLCPSVQIGEPMAEPKSCHVYFRTY